ncbi:LAFE_0B04346g1_1 [Lachancea fermentati]|uniref:LAFE_0B04346g1_1 n=1 Tax=Lachancea fermentati TaxID=4955 RepID=A0A1G4M7P7_LACFM|nr:LAFE_0B04346g1_1 [Lachancea fermentati]
MENSSVSSLSSKDVSSAISLYNLSTADGNENITASRSGFESDQIEDPQASAISRPLSRSSVTSSLSMIATKDGVEGRKVHRYGIPQYSLNLLNSMAQSHLKKQLYPKSHEDSGLNGSQDFPSAPPMTLRDKMRLLNDKSYLPHLSSSVESFNDDIMDMSLDDTHDLKDSKTNSRSFYEMINSEDESNLSTIGDDASYLHDTRSLPPVLVTANFDGTTR